MDRPDKLAVMVLLGFAEIRYPQITLYTFNVHTVDKVKLLQVTFDRIVLSWQMPQFSASILKVRDGQDSEGGTQLKISSVGLASMSRTFVGDEKGTRKKNINR